MSETINPITGLPAEAKAPKSPEIKVNPITGLEAVPKAPELEKMGTRISENIDVLKNMGAKEYESFKDYGVNVTSGIDHNEARAQNQSTIEKIGRGVAKAYVTAGGALAENTVGLLWGLGSVATGGNFYDNSFGRAIDSMNEWAAEVMPHYYTRKEQQADVFSLTNLTSANFWADKVANGVGYVMGSIATDAALAYATGGSSLILTAAKYASKLGKAKAVLNAAQKAKAFSNVYRATKAAQQGKKVADVLLDGANASSRIKRLSGMRTAVAQAETGLISAIGESNVESRQAKHETLNGLIENWVNNNPGMSEEDIPEEVRAEMEDVATAAGNTVFAINLPVIGGTNALMLGRLAGPGFKSTARSLAAKRAQESIYNIRRATSGDNIGKFVDAGLDGGWARRTLTKASRKFGEPIKGMGEEAFQEGTQFFAGNFAREYFSDNYLRGAESGTLVDAMSYGLSQTFGSKEGVESMLIGAIIGGGSSSVSRVADKLKGRQSARAIKQETTQKALDILNSGVFNGAIENLKLSEEATKYAAVMEDATATAADPNATPEQRKKAHKRFKDAQYKLIANQAFTLSSMGRMNLALEQLEDAKDLSDDEFKKAFGYDINEPLPEGGKAAVIDKLKNKLVAHKETLDKINEIAPKKTPTTGLPRRLMSEEEIEQENLEIESSNFYRQTLYNRATQLTGHMERMDNMLNEMDKLSGDKNAINRDNLEEYTMDQGMSFFFEDKGGIAITSENKVGGKVKEELDAVESKIIDPQKKKDFAAFKEDYLNLLAERQEIINSYEALTGPEGPATAEYLKNRQEALDMLASKSTAEIEAEELLNNAEVPSDLLNKIPEGATAEQKERAKAKIIFLMEEVNKLAKAYEGQTLDQLRAIDKDKLGQIENGRMQVAALEKAIEKKEAVQKFEKENLKNTDSGNEVESNPPNTNPNPGVGAPQDSDMFGGATDIDSLIQAKIDAAERAIENASGNTREQGAGQGRGVTADQLNLSDDQNLDTAEDQVSPRERVSTIPYKGFTYTITEDERILNPSGIEVYKSNTPIRRKILANYRVANKQAVVVKPKTRGLKGKSFTVSKAGVILNNKTGTVMGEWNKTTDKNLTAEDRKIILDLAEGQFAAMDIQAAPKKTEEVKQVTPAQGSIDVSLISTNYSTSEGNSNNVFVTESGELERNTPSTQTVDGEVILIEDGELYDPNNTLEGQTVTFEVREDTDWAKSQGDLSWKNVPIFVVLNGRRVGLLQSYFEDSKKGSARQEIFRISKEGGTPTATVSGKGGFKFLNAVNQDGSRAFTNPLDQFENPIFAVVSSENGMLRYQLGEVTGVPAEELAELEDSLVERNSKLEQDKVTEGQVVMMVKTPTGKYAPFPLSTKYLTDSDIAYTLKFMAEGKAREAMEIAGFNGDPYNWNGYAKDRNGAAKKSFLYYVEAGNFYVFHSDTAGQLVSINPEELSKMANDEGFRFSFVEGPSKEADEVNDNFIVSSGRSDYSSVAPKLKEDLVNLLQRKKYQVSKESINNKTSRRVDPITGETQDYRTYLFNGGIVQTDGRNNNGGPFHGVQLKFGAINTEGKATPKEETDTTILPGPDQGASGKFERTAGKRKGKKRPSKPTQQSSDIDAKKADIERRRSASLGITEMDRVSAYVETKGDDIGEGYYQDSEGNEITTYDEDPNKKWTTEEIINWVNDKFDAELAALESQPTQPQNNKIQEAQEYFTENTKSTKDFKYKPDLSGEGEMALREQENALLELGADEIQAHGFAKGSVGQQFKDLLNILTNGIDSRGGGQLYTAPLVLPKNMKAGVGAALGTGGGTAYIDGGFIILAKAGVNQIKSIDDIGGVLVNEAVDESLPELVNKLKSAFPNLSIESYSNSTKAVQDIKLKQPTQQASEVQGSVLSAGFENQGTQFALEIQGNNKPFLLTWNRNNSKPSLWGKRKDDGSYTTTDAFPSTQDVQKLVDKYVPKNLLNLLNEWTAASKLPAREVLDAQEEIEKRIETELAKQSQAAPKIISLPKRDTPADVLAEMSAKVGGQLNIPFPANVLPNTSTITKEQLEVLKEAGKRKNKECK